LIIKNNSCCLSGALTFRTNFLVFFSVLKIPATGSASKSALFISKAVNVTIWLAQQWEALVLNYVKTVD
jgi:hypothetical protein